jgi:hypothetical protein
MPDVIGVEVVGARSVELQFERFPERLRGQLTLAITKITDTLAGRIRSAAPRRSGRLAGSIRNTVYQNQDSVAGYIAVSEDFAKAGALEYGAPGPRNRNQVKAHEARLDHLWGNKLAQPLTVMVAAHTRTLKVKAHRYLRDPTAAMSGEVLAAIEQACETATNE